MPVLMQDLSFMIMIAAHNPGWEESCSMTRATKSCAKLPLMRRCAMCSCR